MKKTLSVLALLGVIGMAGMGCANAFSWSNLNPFHWGKCNKCEKKVEKATCPTGYAAPCESSEKTVNSPCKEAPKPAPCDACDRIQQEMAK